MSVAVCRDTAGQERYASLAPLYYRGASAATVVYDITNAESFQKAKQWVSELQKNASGAIGAPNTPQMISANLSLGTCSYIVSPASWEASRWRPSLTACAEDYIGPCSNHSGWQQV